MPPGFRTIFASPRKVELEPEDVGDPGRGEVLLRTERTLISTGTELTALTGDFPPESAWAAYIKYPCPVGYSSVATVAAVGEGVDSPKVGERVVSMAGHATYARRSAAQVWKTPPGLDPEPASFATLAEIVMGGVRRSGLMFGESVVIVGAGLIGQIATQFCRVAGAWPIVVIDTAKERLETARRMGATHTLPSTADDARGAVEEASRGRMADIVFDVTGHPLAFPGAVKLARRLGRVVLLGSPRGPVTIDLHDEVHSRSLTIIGAHNSAHPPVETVNTPWTMARHIELMLEWQNGGVIDLRPLITHRYSWTDAPAAYQLLLDDRTRALGVVLDWSERPSE